MIGRWRSAKSGLVVAPELVKGARRAEYLDGEGGVELVECASREDLSQERLADRWLDLAEPVEELAP